MLNADQKYEWKKGHPDASPLPQQTMELLNQIVFPYYFDLFLREDDKEVIERVIVNMSELAEELGPAAYKDVMPKVIEVVNKFLDKKMVCQGGESEIAEAD